MRVRSSIMAAPWPRADWGALPPIRLVIVVNHAADEKHEDEPNEDHESERQEGEDYFNRHVTPTSV